MKGWIYNMFGAPRRFLADNGGEFANDLYREMCENLNIEVLNTGAESPWSNGLVERNHACVDLMLEKMLEDNPSMKIELALSSAVHAKNCQPMVFGWSPIHLVTGKPPIIHQALTDDPPALCRSSSSKVFAERANAAIAARDAFNEVEKSSRLRRALLKKISIQTEVYQNGDKVFYKSGKSNKWKGKAKVVAVDGKIIFIKHGRSYLAVSPTRLIKANRLYKQYGNEIDKLGPAEERENDSDSSEDENHEDESNKFLSRKQRENDPPSLNPVNSLLPNPVIPHPNTDENVFVPGLSGGDDFVPDSTDRVENLLDLNQQNPRFPTISNSNLRQSSEAAGCSRKHLYKSRKSYPKKGEVIKFRVDKNKNDWQEVEIGNTAYKGGVSRRKNEDYVNVKYKDGRVGGISLDKVEWKYLEDDKDNDENEDVLFAVIPDQNHQDNIGHIPQLHDDDTEETFVVFIPRDQWGSKPVIEAKNKELENFKMFGVYKSVEDIGQERISTSWVITEKMMGETKGVKARLVAHGNLESSPVRSDSPTIGKSTLRLQFSVAAQFGWKIETSDVKAAFLQGSNLPRQVFVIPPAEAQEEGRLWLLIETHVRP